MGHGAYSHDAHAALLQTRSGMSPNEVFAQRGCHALMNPKGVRVRESRDSIDHPHSLGVVFALDVTGSMGDIPQLLATQQLPTFMKVILDCGITDPQLMFMAIGDANSDGAPLQVGQFESSAELMDQWLTRSYLEGGGGGSGEESYELGLYFVAQHIEMDCMVRRNTRGYLFMTGDELPYPTLSRHIVDSIIGDRLDDDLRVDELIAELQTSFHPFFLVPHPHRATRCGARWRELLGDNMIVLDDPSDVCWASAAIMVLTEGLVADVDALSDRLHKAGIPADRRKPVIAALEPYAESLSRHGRRSTATAKGFIDSVTKRFHRD